MNPLELLGTGLGRRKRASRNVRVRIRLALRERDGDLCCHCGEAMEFEDSTSRDFASIEHVVPHCMGGEYSAENGLLAHTRCNQASQPALARAGNAVAKARRRNHQSLAASTATPRAVAQQAPALEAGPGKDSAS